jgi:hypothetical protein
LQEEETRLSLRVEALRRQNAMLFGVLTDVVKSWARITRDNCVTMNALEGFPRLSVSNTAPF